MVELWAWLLDIEMLSFVIPKLTSVENLDFDVT